MAQRRPTAERQKEIADAALGIIATQGIVSLTMATLAKAVGVSTGALFKHFESRDAILDEVSRRAEELLRDTQPQPTLPPSERLATFLEARTGVAARHAGLLRLLLSEQFTLALPAGAARRLRSAIADTRQLVLQTMVDGQVSGVFRNDQPAAALAVIVLGTVQMLAFSAALGSNSSESIQVRTTLRLLLDGEAPHRRKS